jgi:hypothetical protein
MVGPPQMSRAGLTLMLYPFGLGAMAVNLFFASLIGSWLGLPVLSPWQSVVGGAMFGIPASWLFAGHITRLMAKADQATSRGDRPELLSPIPVPETRRDRLG